MKEHQDLILDGTKINWHLDRVKKWENGERIAPISIDMALTRACNYSCGFCYAMLQENDRKVISREIIFNFLDDCAEIGVKGISFVSDGESTISPVFIDACKKGHELGLSMAVGTNAFVLTKNKLEEVLPYLTYLRVNFSGGERKRYAEIMGVKESAFDRVCQNIRDMVAIKKRDNLSVTIGMQMVLMPQDGDQIIPLAKLGKELRPDYTIIKHCSDNEDGDLGIDYEAYENLYDLLQKAEKYSDEDYKVVIKWSKIKDKGNHGRSYQRCYGAPFILQLSGSGLIAPCGALFNEKYKKFHIGNICDQRFKDIWNSDRYWEVMNYLSSPKFNAQKMCGSLCLQHNVNETLDNHVKGKAKLKRPEGVEPKHITFIKYYKLIFFQFQSFFLVTSFLKAKAKKLRQDTFLAFLKKGEAHLGGSFSMIEILLTLYEVIMKKNDKFILSKAHASYPLCILLQDKGLNPKLSTHLELDAKNGIHCTTGSLGHGLPIATGMAFARKKQKISGKVYVMISDGECQQGTTWESLLIGSKHKLDNLVVIIDYNKIQALTRLKDALPLENLLSKFKAFNWNCIEVKNGHSFKSLVTAFKKQNKKGRPSAIIINTIKGKGIKDFENNPIWHARKLKGKDIEIGKMKLGIN